MSGGYHAQSFCGYAQSPPMKSPPAHLAVNKNLKTIKNLGEAYDFRKGGERTVEQQSTLRAMLGDFGLGYKQRS